MATLMTESRGEKGINQEMKNEIASLKESVVKLSKVVEGYESTINKMQIKALKVLIMAERLKARFARLVQNAEGLNHE